VQGDLVPPEVIEAKLTEFDALLERNRAEQKPAGKATRPAVSVV
jgi:hypothetical protein